MTRNVVAAICKECPCKRDSAQGYLGSAKSAADFIYPHWYGELPLPCHMQVDWEGLDPQEQAETVPLCRGLLTLMRNSHKLPKNNEILEAMLPIETDYETVFSFLSEFLEYHDGEIE